jgi:ABC-type uncharacterized transport system ATPase subunit
MIRHQADVFLFSVHFGHLRLVFGSRQAGTPTQSDPLLDIIGQTRPQDFQERFGQATDPKLS